METKETFKAAPNVAWRKIENEVIILDLETSDYFSLNEVGTRIWELLQEGKDEDSVAEVIEAEYEIDKKNAKKDVAAFLKQLKKEKIAGS